LLFKTNRFSRLFPTIGSQIITEPRSLEDFPCLERTSCPTDESTLAIPQSNCKQNFRIVAHRVVQGNVRNLFDRPGAHPNLPAWSIHPIF
jgi:hypothetical protein